MKVLLVSDSPLIFAGLRSVLLDTIHTTDVTETPSLEKCQQLCITEPYRLIIIDLGKISSADVDIIGTIKQSVPDLTVWVNLRADFTLLRPLLAARVNGLFSSSSSFIDFKRASHKFDSGTRFISEEIQEQLVAAIIGKVSWPVLTARQEKVADLLAAGVSRQVIAEQIRVKPATVTHYRQVIFKKLGIASMNELRQKRSTVESII